MASCSAASSPRASTVRLSSRSKPLLFAGKSRHGWCYCLHSLDHIDSAIKSCLSCATSWTHKCFNANANQPSFDWPMTRETPSWSALKTTILPSWPTVTISGLLHTRAVQGALSHGKWCARAQRWETEIVCSRSAHDVGNAHQMTWQQQSIILMHKIIHSIKAVVPNSCNMMTTYFDYI